MMTPLLLASVLFPLLAQAVPESLTLEQAIERAVARSHQLAAARNEMALWSAEVDAARRPFVPELAVGTSYRLSVTPEFSPYFDFSRDSTRASALAASVGLNGRLAWGTEYRLQLKGALDQNDSFSTRLSPAYSAPVELSISQPLLRGLGMVNQRELRMAAARREQSGALLSQVANEVVLAAARAYVELQAAQARLEYRQGMLALARSLYEVTQALIKAGRLPPSAEIPEAIVLSGREQDVGQAELDLQQAQVELAEALDEEQDSLILASDPLVVRARVPDQTEAVALAREANPELLAMRRECDLHRIDLSVRQNQALPDLRLQASAGAIGVSGRSLCNDGYYLDGMTPCAIPDVIAGGPEQAALSSALGRFFYAEAGVVFSMPLDRSPDRRSIEATNVILRRMHHQLEDARSRITRWAARGVRNIHAFEKLLQEARRSVELAERGVESAKESYTLGKTTVFDLIKAQDLLALARDREVSTAHRLALESLALRAVTGQLVPTTIPLASGRL